MTVDDGYVANIGMGRIWTSVFWMTGGCVPDNIESSPGES